MLRYLSYAALIGWLIYSWPLALAVAGISGFITLFYSAAIDGRADDKVNRTFHFAVITLSVIVLLMIGNHEVIESEDQQKYCSGVQC